MTTQVEFPPEGGSPLTPDGLPFPEPEPPPAEEEPGEDDEAELDSDLPSLYHPQVVYEFSGEDPDPGDDVPEEPDEPDTSPETPMAIHESEAPPPELEDDDLEPDGVPEPEPEPEPEPAPPVEEEDIDLTKQQRRRGPPPGHQDRSVSAENTLPAGVFGSKRLETVLPELGASDLSIEDPDVGEDTDEKPPVDDDTTLSDEDDIVDDDEFVDEEPEPGHEDVRDPVEQFTDSLPPGEHPVVYLDEGSEDLEPDELVQVEPFSFDEDPNVEPEPIAAETEPELEPEEPPIPEPLRTLLEHRELMKHAEVAYLLRGYEDTDKFERFDEDCDAAKTLAEKRASDLSFECPLGRFLTHISPR